MNKIKYISFLIAVAVGVTLFFSCKKTADRPPVTAYNFGNTITVSQLRAIFLNNHGDNYKFTKDVSLYATVIMSDNYKTLYLRDSAGGTITLKQLTAHGINQGDSLRVNLNN